MATFTKTVYIEVEANDRDEANQIVERALFEVANRNETVDFVDLAGPCEEGL